MCVFVGGVIKHMAFPNLQVPNYLSTLSYTPRNFNLVLLKTSDCTNHNLLEQFFVISAFCLCLVHVTFTACYQPSHEDLTAQSNSLFILTTRKRRFSLILIDQKSPSSARIASSVSLAEQYGFVFAGMRCS